MVYGMKTFKIAFFFGLLAVAGFSAACGTILPNKFIYPVEDGKKGETPPAPKEKAAETKPAEAESKPASAATGKSTDGEPQRSPEHMAVNPLMLTIPAPDKKAPPVVTDAIKISSAPNTLQREFNMGSDQAWDRILGFMVGGPLIVVDKSSGLIISDWIFWFNPEADAMGGGLFGDGQRLTRYKYAVKIEANGERSAVKVISYTQYSQGKRWVDGKAQDFIGQQLMKKIIDVMEAQ